MPVPSPLKPRAPRREWARLPAFPKRICWLSVPVAVVVFAMAGFWRSSPPDSTRTLPGHARYGFVLDGQSPDGNRTKAGLALLRSGRIDTLIVSGVELGGGVFFSMIYVRSLPLVPAEKGRIFEMRSTCTSTMDEARMMDEFFRSRKTDTAIVVTSDYHVWRAASIFAKVSGTGMVWRFHGSPDAWWESGWATREGRKSRIMEWAKRVNWVLIENWIPTGRSTPVKPHALHGGSELGAFPSTAWKP